MENVFDDFADMSNVYKRGLDNFFELEEFTKKDYNVLKSWSYIKDVQDNLKRSGFNGANELVYHLLNKELKGRYGNLELNLKLKKNNIIISVYKIKVFEIDVNNNVLYSCCNMKSLIERFDFRISKRESEIMNIEKSLYDLKYVYDNFNELSKNSDNEDKIKICPYVNKKAVELDINKLNKYKKNQEKSLDVTKLQREYFGLVRQDVSSFIESFLSTVNIGESITVVNSEKIVDMEYINTDYYLTPPSKYIKLYREAFLDLDKNKELKEEYSISYNPCIDYLKDLIKYLDNVKTGKGR